MEISKGDEFWNNFLIQTGRNSEEKCSGDLNFEAKGFNNDALVTMIMAGKKTAVFVPLATYNIDGEPVPVTGELYLVFDRNQNPRCVIELESVNVIPFCEVTWEMAKKEGEDENFEQWQQKMQEYLEDEGSIVGFDFKKDLLLVYQTFKCIYKGN